MRNILRVLIAGILLLAVPAAAQEEELTAGTEITADLLSAGEASPLTDEKKLAPETYEDPGSGTGGKLPPQDENALSGGDEDVSLDTPSITGCYNSVYGADIRWKKTDGAEGYNVFRFRSAEGLTLVQTVFGENTTQCYDDSIRDNCWGRVYVYYVQAFFGRSVSERSAGATLQRLAPMEFSGYTTASAGSATLKWTCSVASNKSDGYELQFAESKTDLYDQSGTFRKTGLTGRNSLSKALTGLDKNKTCYFRVRAYVYYTHSVTGKQTKSWSQYSNVIGFAPTGVTTVQYRALLIGNSNYPGGRDDLYGPPFDVMAIGNTLKNYGYTVSTKRNLNASQITSAISSAFKSAGPNDVSLFFYSGHGDNYSGSLIGTDNSELSLDALAAALKKVSGRVVIILDSCGSGGGIYQVSASQEGEALPEAPAFDPDAFNQLVIDTFSAADPGLSADDEYELSDGSLPQVGWGELRSSKFLVLTASERGGASQDLFSFTQGWGGAMSKGIVSGAGCSFPGGTYTGTIPADSNKDKKLSLTETYKYAQKYVDRLTSNTQTLRYYPTNSSDVIMVKK